MAKHGHRRVAYAMLGLVAVVAVVAPTTTAVASPAATEGPVVTPPADGSLAVGKPVAIAVSPPPTGPTPTGYLYQLNAGPYGSVDAATDGTASITVVPTEMTNTLAVASLYAGGGIGDSTAIFFNAIPAPPAIDGDFTGDDITDLLTVGGAHGLPSGLWLAAGDNTGALSPTATNIGTYGNGAYGTNSPTDFDSAQILTGRFTGNGPQDILVYYPTGSNAGGGVVLRGNGDGSPIRADLSGNSANIPGGFLADINNCDPLQLANAGSSSGQSSPYPDLLAISGNDSIGYYLNHYANPGGLNNYQFPTQLSTPTPTGSMDWNTWHITTAQTASGTAMFLWQPTSGKLYLWNGVTFDANTSALTYSEHALSSNWNTGQSMTVHGGDINGDGTGDLWTVGDSATAIAWLVTDLTSGTGTISAEPSQTIAFVQSGWSTRSHRNNAATIR
jgi:hypothetical protein